MAATAIAMPKLGMTMREGLVVAWRAATGQRVEKGEIILVIESEKSEIEIEAPAAGILRHVYVEAGSTVPCGTLLGVLTGTADEVFDAPAFQASLSAPELGNAPARAIAPGGVAASGKRDTEATAWRSSATPRRRSR